MSTFGQRLWNRRFGLSALAAVTILIVLDTSRPPADQYTAEAYVGSVRVYQAVGRPVVRPFCTCRYLPSCSEYSAEAVRTHGLRYGLFLTAKRLLSCNGNVPLGTWDPVPPTDERK